MRLSSRSYILLFLQLVCILNILRTTNAGNVLVYPYGHCLNSHLLTMEKLVHILIKNGHHVTMLVPETYEGPYEKVDFSSVNMISYKVQKDIKPLCGFDSLSSFMGSTTAELWQKFQSSTLAFCESLLGDNEVMKYIKHKTFDLAIYEHVDYCSRILADYIDVPFISLISQGIESIYPRTPTHLPTILSCYTDQMSMFQRLKNTLIYGFQKIFVMLTLNKYEKLKQKFHLNESLSLSNVPDKAQVKFVLGHHAIDYPGPILPSTVMISNLQNSLPPKYIPPDVQKFLDDATEGVIYFSFGSMINGWDEAWQRVFVTAFHSLPYKVLWKTAGRLNTSIECIDSKIKTTEWAPQFEILKHKNVVLFLTHGGLNSALEVARAGKPVVVIPLFADQFYQAKKLVERAQLGTEIDIRSLNVEKLASTIKYTVKTTKFQENAKHISKIMNSDPVPNGQMIAYWTNFVIEHKGVPHLRSRVQSMSWYEVILLDCVAVLLAVIVVLTTTCKAVEKYTKKLKTN